MRRWGADTDAAITRIRRDLEAQGKEPGAWSVWWVLSQGGSRQAPSRSTIARRMRALGLVVPAPRKRPRSSWKRFTRTSANELWQLDGIEWRLAGRPVTVYQAIDDCSRVITALKAFWGGESHQGAKEALEAAFRDWGRPAALLSDNGPAPRAPPAGRVRPAAPRGGWHPWACAPSADAWATPRPRARSNEPTRACRPG